MISTAMGRIIRYAECIVYDQNTDIYRFLNLCHSSSMKCCRILMTSTHVEFMFTYICPQNGIYAYDSGRTAEEITSDEVSPKSVTRDNHSSMTVRKSTHQQVTFKEKEERGNLHMQRELYSLSSILRILQIYLDEYVKVQGRFYSQYNYTYVFPYLYFC